MERLKDGEMERLAETGTGTGTPSSILSHRNESGKRKGGRLKRGEYLVSVSLGYTWLGPVQRTLHVQRQRKWQRQTESKMATTMAHRKWLLTPAAPVRHLDHMPPSRIRNPESKTQNPPPTSFWDSSKIPNTFQI